SSLLFGGTFALGWSPCIGPILGSVLTLAASSATVGQGAFLLGVFSLGLAVPFLAVALGIGWAFEHLGRLGAYANWVGIAGGVFLLFLGALMLTNNFGWWLGAAYRLFDFINYEALLNYL
ncbi:MAG: cytochrome c biogenesis protein CcdA, partial [Candidatus Pacearchaeota archaeon]|nr:cytochrome c biogenesis protein CcdA [Candidatus Pacearchaeota archaeon]